MKALCCCPEEINNRGLVHSEDRGRGEGGKFLPHMIKIVNQKKTREF